MVRKKQASALREDQDYYINEEGFMVFTSDFHLARGFCCKSGCKHCPYGFNKTAKNATGEACSVDKNGHHDKP